MSHKPRAFLMSCALLLLFSEACFPQGRVSISGIVTDDHHRPLAYAGVYLPDSSIGTSTNERGEYTLEVSEGRHEIACRYLGYQKQQKTIVVGPGGLKVDFVLPTTSLKISEVVVRSGPDPAYAIMRQAIKKRPFYEKQVNAYRCKVYVKGIVRVDEAPKKILGQKMDYGEAGIDTTGSGIVFLSESLSNISVEKPHHIKQVVISSHQSGGGLGFDFPVFIDFYQNNVPLVSRRFTPRGYISPLADNAMHYYRYHLEGTFEEDGKEINKIKVTPRRDQEPLFRGYINIISKSWRIHSLQLLVTRHQQLQLLDSMEISQIHAPLGDSIWRIRNQAVRFKFNQLGFKLRGTFLDVYSGYDLHPHFPPDYFKSRIILRYDSLADKRSDAYWDSARSVPMEPEESANFRVRDSTAAAREDSLQSKRYTDSLRHELPPLKPMDVLWRGYDLKQHKPKGMGLFWAPTLKRISYNTVEGLVTRADVSFYSKRPSGASWALTPDLRYGWHNQHFSPSLVFVYNTSQEFGTHWEIAGGKRVSQFNHDQPIYDWTNTLNTLFVEENYMKIYENYFGHLEASRRYTNGLSWQVALTYEDRYPLHNTTYFTFIHYKRMDFTSNHPYELKGIPFTRHQALGVSIDLTYQPGQRYIQYPWGKTPVGSMAPVIKVGYAKGLPGVLGSDVDYDKWFANLRQNVNLRLLGILKYKFQIGGFLNTRSVEIPDMKHFNGNKTIFNLKYLNSFQLAPYYAYSNDASLYSTMNVEYHLNGLLTNKIPLFNRLNWNLVCGFNAIYIHSGSHYEEVFGGLENIFKIFRVDFVTGFSGGGQSSFGIRIGLGGILGGPIRSAFQSRDFNSGND